MSNGSFYRLRSKLLPFGVDVAFVQPKEVSNVIPLVRVLEAVPARVPDWAEGTALYFEPRLVA
jgi:II/X family phage/plasmid replication protein